MQFIFLGAYALVLCAIAIFSLKRTKTLNDFFLGGRRIGAWLSAFAYGTTYFSAVIFVGYAGKFGWNIGIWSLAIGIGNALIGSYLAWKVLGRRTYKMTRELGATTMPEFFEKRYGSKGMKIFGAAVIFIFLVPYSASVYTGLSYLFEQVFGIPFVWCVVGMAAVTALYLVLGGYIATALTDLFQGFVMIVGLVLMVFFVTNSEPVGGLISGLAKVSETTPELMQLPQGKSLLTLISIVVLTSLGSWGMPQMVHKFYAIRDEQAIKHGTVISTGFALLIGVGAYFTGVFARLILNGQMPIDPATGAQSVDMVIPTMLTNVLPDALLVLIVILVLSASMSTLASIVIASASSVSIDFLGTVKPNADPKKSVALMRVLCLIFIGISVYIALGKVAEIVTLMSYSWGAIAGTFLGPVSYTLWDKKTSKAGAWGGMILGFGTNVVWALLSGLDQSMAPVIGSTAMLVSLISVPILSRLLPEKEPSLCASGPAE